MIVSDPSGVGQAAAFVVVGAVNSVGFGLDGTIAAALPGQYAFALPAAVLGAVAPLGVAGFYLALLLQTDVPGGVTDWFFRSGRWKTMSPGTDRRLIRATVRRRFSATSERCP